jgi:hypothetical protein
MCDHVWILEARTRRRSGMCGVYRMEASCREPGIQTHGGPNQEKPSGLAPRAALGVAFRTFSDSLYARARRTFAGRAGLRCGHTQTGSDQRRLSVQREGGHNHHNYHRSDDPQKGSIAPLTIGGRHCRSVGLLRLDAPTFESLNNSRGGECGDVKGDCPKRNAARPHERCDLICPRSGERAVGRSPLGGAFVIDKLVAQASEIDALLLRLQQSS